MTFDKDQRILGYEAGLLNSDSMQLYQGPKGSEFALYLDDYREAGTGHARGDAFSYSGVPAIGVKQRGTVVRDARLYRKPAVDAPADTWTWPSDGQQQKSLTAQTRVDLLASTQDKSWCLVLYPDLRRGVARSWMQASAVELDKPGAPDDRVGAAFLIHFADRITKR